MYQNIYDLIDKIRQKPLLFLKEKSLWELHAFIWGYELCLRVHNIDESYGYRQFVTNDFSEWLRKKTKWSMIQSWPGAIYENVKNQEEAFNTFFELVEEYKKDKS